MKRIKTLVVFLLTIFLISCSNTGWKVSNVKEIPVGSGDSVFFISKKDKTIFSLNCNQVSLLRENIALFQNDDKWGFIDESGEVILSDVYKHATVFKNNMAWVVRDGDLPGVINSKGDLKFTLREVDWVEIYIEDMARYYTIEKKQPRYGFANIEGEKVIPPLYYDATYFSEGLAAVKGVENKWGYIDKTGTVIIPAVFDSARVFINEHATVAVENKWGIIDMRGEYILEPRFEDLIADGELFITLSNNKWGWTDINGNWVIEPLFDKVMPFNGAEFAPVLVDGKWAFADKYGEIKIKRQFDEAYPFSKGLALVKIGEYYGFINNLGKYEINPQYTYISPDYISNLLTGLPYFSSVLSDW